MQRVFVLGSTKKPLMPCHPARARELPGDGKAAVYRRIPFTIILKDRFCLPIVFSSGGRTKFNRSKQNYLKDHWVDAACVSETGEMVFIHPSHKPLLITAESRGSRQKCLPDKFGFPRTAPKAKKRVFGFQTGDLVKAKVTKGKKTGQYVGRVAVRSTGNFNVKTEDKVTHQGISHKFCRIIQRNDGYSYSIGSEKRKDNLRSGR